MTKAAAAKAPNYSEEEVTRIIETYTNADDKKAAVDSLAVALGRSTRAIVMKLVSLKKYEAAPKVSKITGEAPVVKSELASELGKLVGLTDAEADSAEKLTKSALLKIIAAVKASEAES